MKNVYKLNLDSYEIMPFHFFSSSALDDFKQNDHAFHIILHSFLF